MCNLRLILGFTLAASLPFATAQAAPADLPETGQVTCYDSANPANVIACAGTGQDGDLRAGVAWPAPRFVVGTGAMQDCVTDNLTGLMWTRNANLPAAAQSWQQALDYANNLTLCGFSDWRLPNVTELESLVNREFINQAAFLNAQNAQDFINVQATDYWSSSSYAASAAFAWTVKMSGGIVSVFTKSSSVFVYVWPVRAGQ